MPRNRSVMHAARPADAPASRRVNATLRMVAAMALMSALLCAGPAQAQLGALPPLPVDTPPVQTPPLVREQTDPLLRRTQQLTGDLAYAAQSRLLAREAPREIALDANGAAMLRAQYLVLGADAAALAAAQRAGFAVDTQQDEAATLELLALSAHNLRDTRDRSPSRALRALRAAMPGVEVSAHHVYLPAGVAAPSPAASFREISTASQSDSARVLNAQQQIIAQRGPAAMTPDPRNALRVGLIDSGVDAAHPALARSQVHRHGCAGRAVPAAHGTAVAARLVAGDSTTLYAADLWCGQRVGRGTLGLVQALDWLARERVIAINISLVGPDNPVLARAVRAMIARGHVLIAAAGNDGPAAPPLFPAAYPDVIGIGAVDAKRRPLPESARGPQVDFCAVGIVDASASTAGTRKQSERDRIDAQRARRGTSLAAPLAARLAARALAQNTQSGNATSLAYRALQAQAEDIGPRGRDPRCGEGVLRVAE